MQISASITRMQVRVTSETPEQQEWHSPLIPATSRCTSRS